MAFWLIQWEYHFVGYRQKKAGKEITWCVEMALPDQKRSEQSGDESLVALGALKFRYYVDSIFAIFTWKLNQAHTDRQTHTWGRSVGSFGVILVLPQACFLVGWPWPPPTFELPAPISRVPAADPPTSPGHFLIRRRLSVIYVKYFLWKKQQQPPTELFCGNKHEI